MSDVAWNAFKVLDKLENNKFLDCLFKRIEQSFSDELCVEAKELICYHFFNYGVCTNQQDFYSILDTRLDYNDKQTLWKMAETCFNNYRMDAGIVDIVLQHMDKKDLEEVGDEDEAI